MRTVIRNLALPVLLVLPALAVRISGTHVPPPVGLLVFGLAVVAASFVLAWAAEAAEMDISGGLAVAILAVIAVLPEYAVDLFFAYRAGSDPAYVQYAAANMTGSNRLLLGLGWSAVVLVSLAVVSRRSGKKVKEVVLEAGHRLEVGFLAIAALIAFIIPISGQINIVLGVVLLAFFVFYLIRVGLAGEASEPELVGPAAPIGALPTRIRRPVVIIMFTAAAVIIFLCAEPFAESLISSGKTLGVDEFLLVQWLAPLASEAPEFIVALIFASRGNAVGALGMLISAKVNQWTLLIGSLPVAYLFGGGDGVLRLDARQIEEVLLTAAQTVLGVAILLALRFPRWAAYALLALFAVQFAIPSTTGRLILSGVYLVIAVVAVVINRHHLWITLTTPFRRLPKEPQPSEPELESVTAR
ncbi:MAG: sodium:proton exchanger [Propionibacteriales bacterium]|nr:sodium:proton exchanger [Propionibacteriales bacterium]